MDPQQVSADDVGFLELLGGFADFVSQRCQHMLEHPDGLPGQVISFSSTTMELGVLLRGAVLQIFAEIGCRMHEDLGHVANFDMPTSTSLAIGFRLDAKMVPTGPGAAVLSTLASTTRVVSRTSGMEWHVEIDAISLRSGLYRLGLFMANPLPP